MKKLLLMLLCLPMIGFGQQGWETYFHGISNGSGFTDAVGYSVIQNTDGDYIVIGSMLVKIDADGNEKWRQEIQGYDVQQTSDGGYIICSGDLGFHEPLITAPGLGQYYSLRLTKVNQNGQEQWSQNFGGDSLDGGYSVQQTSDGGYIICGGTESFGNGSFDVWLIKTDGNGIEQWSKTFGGAGYDIGKSVQQTSDGGYIICGSTESFGNGNRDAWLIKTDGNGTEQWNKLHTFSFPYDDSETAESVQQTSDGGYILTGNGIYSLGSQFPHAGWVIKTDNNGDEQWNRSIGISQTITLYSAQQTTDGGYVFGGSEGPQMYLLKMDDNGFEEFERKFEGFGIFDLDDDIPFQHLGLGYSAKQTSDGGYIICGVIDINFYEDIYLVKTNSEGIVTSTFNIPINPNRKLEKTVDILGKETKPQTNTPFIEIYDDGTVEKRIVIE